MPTNNQAGNGAAKQIPEALPSSPGLVALVLGLVKPYYKWLLIIFLAMLAETALSLATPWPLKVIIDNVIGDHRLPQWMAWIRDLPIGGNRRNLAAFAAVAMILLTVLAGLASYISSYFTESLAQLPSRGIYLAGDGRVLPIPWRRCSRPG